MHHGCVVIWHPGHHLQAVLGRCKQSDAEAKSAHAEPFLEVNSKKPRSSRREISTDFAAEHADFTTPVLPAKINVKKIEWTQQPSKIDKLPNVIKSQQTGYVPATVEITTLVPLVPQKAAPNPGANMHNDPVTNPRIDDEHWWTTTHLLLFIIASLGLPFVSIWVVSFWSKRKKLPLRSIADIYWIYRSWDRWIRRVEIHPHFRASCRVRIQSNGKVAAPLPIFLNDSFLGSKMFQDVPRFKHHWWDKIPSPLIFFTPPMASVPKNV